MTREEEIKREARRASWNGDEWANERPNGSIIKWQTGEPKEAGEYLVTTLEGIVDYDIVYINSKGNMTFGNFDNVLAWCKLSDIEPYKEKEE